MYSFWCILPISLSLSLSHVSTHIYLSVYILLTKILCMSHSVPLNLMFHFSYILKIPDFESFSRKANAQRLMLWWKLWKMVTQQLIVQGWHNSREVRPTASSKYSGFDAQQPAKLLWPNRTLRDWTDQRTKAYRKRQHQLQTFTKEYRSSQ